LRCPLCWPSDAAICALLRDFSKHDRETLAEMLSVCVIFSTLAEDFRKGGPQAIAKVRKEQPAAYMKICALLVPREMKVQHSQNIKNMGDA
jgi:hypothetical protein